MMKRIVILPALLLLVSASHFNISHATSEQNGAAVVEAAKHDSGVDLEFTSPAFAHEACAELSPETLETIGGWAGAYSIWGGLATAVFAIGNVCACTDPALIASCASANLMTGVMAIGTVALGCLSYYCMKAAEMDESPLGH